MKGEVFRGGFSLLVDSDARKELESQIRLPEQRMSSHWAKSLEDFEIVKGEFVGCGLPEGRGLPRRSYFYRTAHTVLQAPFRWKGRRFRHFRSLLDRAERIHTRRRTLIDLATLRQVMTLALLEEWVQTESLREPIVVVGDGFGTLSSLLLANPRIRAKIVVVNLTAPLLMDATYIDTSVESVRMCLVTSGEDYLQALNEREIVVVLVQADNAQVIGNGPISLAINIASMQEMNPPDIANYFRLFRKSLNATTLFYCCNRVEKQLPDGTVVRFLDYPWRSGDQILVDELCPWHQSYYINRPPFYHAYDGPLQHRLTILHKDDD